MSVRACPILWLLVSISVIACDDDPKKQPEPYQPRYTLPVFADWACPDGWTATPAFVDADGAEDVPEGMTQFQRCAPPAAWSGPSGPAHLQSWTCPEGWIAEQHERLLDEAGAPLTTCAPPRVARLFVPGGAADGGDYLSPIPEDADPLDYEQCDPSVGERPSLWGTGCVPLGDACPAGVFPTIPAEVTGARIYVLAGATGGDGSEGAPLATIAEAVAAAADGDVIVIGEGAYPEPLVLDRPLTLWGACVERVKIPNTTAVLDPDAAPDPGMAAIFSTSHVILRNLEISSTGYAIVQDVAQGTPGVEASGLYLRRATHAGLLNVSGEGIVRDSVIFDTQPAHVGDAWYSRGLTCASSTDLAHLEVENVLVEQGLTGLKSDGASASIDATDVLVRNLMEAGDSTGACFSVTSGARFTAARIQGAFYYNVGIIAGFEGASMTVDFGAFTHGRANETGTYRGATGEAFMVRDAASAELSHILVRDVVTYGGFNYASELHLSDFLVSGVAERPSDGYYGAGLLVGDGAVSRLERGVIEKTHYTGAMAYHSAANFTGTTLEASDVAFLDALPTPGKVDNLGCGLFAYNRVAASLERCLIEGLPSYGVFVSGEGTSVTLADTVVRNGREALDGLVPIGLLMTDGGAVELSRVVIEDLEGVGIQTGAGAILTGEDVVVSDLDALPSSGQFGEGLIAADLSPVTLTRATFAGCRTAGILALGAEGDTPGVDPNLVLTDVLVTDTQPQESDGTSGCGIIGQLGQHLSLNRVLIDRSRTSGIIAAFSTILTATDLFIRGTRSTAWVDHPGAYGWGAFVFDDSSVSGERWALEDNEDTGIVFEAAAPSTLTDVLIRGTRIGACAALDPVEEDFCLAEGEQPVSRAVALLGPSEVTISSFEFSDNGKAGAQILIGIAEDGTTYETAGTLTLQNGGIVGQDLGVILNDLPDYDVTSLQDEVYYEAVTELSREPAPQPTLVIIPPEK